MQRGDGMDFRGAAQSLRRSFGEAEVADFPLPHQFRHCADSFLDRSRGIDAVLVVKVDNIDAQAAQAGLTGATYVVRLAADGAHCGVCGIANDSELRGQHDLIAFALDRPAHQLFIYIWPVDVGGVEEVDAKFECAVNGGDGFIVITWTVKLRHAHAAEAEG